MNAVCDASPLIALAKAGLLEILPKLFSSVLVPQGVVREILNGPSTDPMRQAVNDLPWLEAVDLDPPVSPLVDVILGKGESEVIEWARSHSDCIALLDDRAARRTGKAVGISVIGTIGVLFWAAKRRVVPSFSEAVANIRSAGLYLPEDTVNILRKELGE
jgi:predicted nucleic acid-binding protein